MTASRSHTVAGPAAPVDATARPEADSVWASFGYFSLYRLVIASIFFLVIVLFGSGLDVGSDKPRLFAWVALCYWLLAIFFFAGLRKLTLPLNAQLTLQVLTDILALTLMMHASGSSRGGLAIMLLVVLAGAGLVGQGRMSLFYAAVATVAVLLEHAFRAISGGETVDFVQAGIMSMGFFATAISARLLAQRVIYNENLARERAVDLANQLSINNRIIRDMQDGVLVVDPAGRVRQCNPRAEALFDMKAQAHADLGAFSAVLAEKFAALPEGQGETTWLLPLPGSTRTLRARLVRTGEGADALVYLEDLERMQRQAQQMKLAALGRLTANMAHEIRNPLSAISHAAELLQEERRADMQLRLSRIIIDNSQRLERLVKDVLELGRRVRPQPETIRLRRFLDTFAEEFAVREGVDSSVCQVEASAEAALEFDAVHLHQVLWNLVGNALRYCRRQAGSIRIVVARRADDRGADIDVIDDGPGVPADSSGQVFEPFFTTHSQGTGLGLYIARELCEANRASLELIHGDSGAHFRISGRNGNEWGDRNAEAARP